MISETQNTEQLLFEKILSFKYDPVGFVQYVFPWREKNSPLAEMDGPRNWQTIELEKIRTYVRTNRKNNEDGKPYTVLYLSICSGRGIGKSAFLSMINYWFISCWFGATALLTANTETQLRTRTMAEVGKWHSMAINGHWFERTALSLKPAKWFKELVSNQLRIDSGYYYCEAQNWSEENPDAFAGVHSSIGTMVSFDEASGIPDSIYNVTDGFFTDNSPIRIWVIISNGRKNTGAFYESFHRDSYYWNNINIDSRTVAGIDSAVYDRIVDQHGLESDVARVEVRGLFPLTGESVFINAELVGDAASRALPPENNAALIMGVDVARTGSNQSVLFFRRGRDARSIPCIKYNERDTMALADKVAFAIDKYDPDMTFIDGLGVGGGVVDRLVQMGYGRRITEVGSGETPHKPHIYLNKRAEMWGNMREYLKVGCISDSNDLRHELMGPLEMTASNKHKGLIFLESKEDMRKRKVASPDEADAFSFTFANPVASGDHKNSRVVQVNNSYIVI